MEMNYDWKNFQSFFISRRKTQVLSSESVDLQGHSHSPIYLIANGNIIVAAFSDGEDLSRWSGTTFDELEAQLGHRELIVFNREKVDQWLGQATECEHYYDQVLFLSQESQPEFVSHSRKSFGSILQKHFLLSRLKSWWSYLFPVTYGVLICLDQNPSQSIFIKVQRGRVRSFIRPDFSTMIPERRKFSGDLVRHLVEHDLIPVQGVFLTSEEWAEWSTLSDPWVKISSALARDRSKLVPFRWGLAVLIFLRSKFKF